jgi:hypothetical protein
LAGTTFTVTGSHTYAKYGLNSVKVTIQEDGTNAVTVTTLGKVLDAPLTATGATLQAVRGLPFTGTVATFTDGNPLAQASSFLAYLTWGDGHTSLGRVTMISPGNFTITGANMYATDGVYQVGVQIKDPGGSVVTTTTQVTVVDPVGPAAPPPSGMVGPPTPTVYGGITNVAFSVFPDASGRARQGVRHHGRRPHRMHARR